MQPRCSTWTGCVLGAVALALLASRIPSGSAGPPPDKKARPEPLPKEVIRPGKEAGSEFAWMRVGPLGFCDFLPEQGGAAGDLPAFSLFDVKKGQLAKLPAPASAFGLNIHMPQETDAPLKELAGLKTLQAL